MFLGEDLQKYDAEHFYSFWKSLSPKYQNNIREIHTYS